MALIDYSLSGVSQNFLSETALAIPYIDFSPDNIYILANWGMAYAEKIVVSSSQTTSATQTTKDYSIFGTSEMYPPELRSYGDNKNYVPIVPKSTDKDSNFCYALELLLDKIKDNTDRTRLFNGYGAFSIAYNPKAATTARFTADPSYLYPQYGGTGVYLESSLTWAYDTDNKTTVKLSIDLVAGLGTDRQSVTTVFAKQITGVEGLWEDRSKNGMFGSWDDTNSTYQSGYEYTAGIITDVQVISSDTVNGLTENEDSIVTKREKYLNEYAFDYNTFVQNYLLVSKPTI
jgi:hypothetical protein